MHIVLILAIIVNILSVILLSIGFFYNFKQPKNKAFFGYLIVGSMFLYVVTLSLASIYCIFENHYLCGFVLFLCVCSNFIIGRLVKYETVKKYTVAQIACYVVSLITLLLIL